MAHPRYPNPQLVEALCEIHFRLSPGEPWKPTKPGEFFKAVIDAYPEIEPITEQGVQLTFGPQSEPRQQLLPPQIRFRLKHRERPILLQISERTFTINALRPYPGWHAVKAEVEGVWPQVAQIVRPEAITRIGMRYINRVRRLSSNEKPAYWLEPCAYVATAALESAAGFSSRLEARLDNENRVIVTLAHDRSDSSEAHGAMILDIDRIVEKVISPEWHALEAEMEKLHEAVWVVFEAARGRNLEALLQGKLQT